MEIHTVENSRAEEYEKTLSRLLQEGFEIVWCAIVPSSVDNYKYKAILKRNEKTR